MDQPERVVPRRLDDPKLDGGRLQAALPPLSWNMIRTQLAIRPRSAGVLRQPFSTQRRRAVATRDIA